MRVCVHCYDVLMGTTRKPTSDRLNASANESSGEDDSDDDDDSTIRNHSNEIEQNVILSNFFFNLKRL